MEQREYVVALKADVNYDEFWNEIENVSTDDGFVPSRRVEIINERPGSTRSCHYSLTDAEAELLRNDPRVYAVELPVSKRDDIFIGKRYTSQNGDFTKTTSDSGSFLNWGLRRCIDITNPYGANTTAEGPYNYLNDGAPVDIIIQDSGIQADHPEFQDSQGNSRLQEIDWYTESGLPGTQSIYHYRDYDGHGTHVASIAAGKTYGWGKGSKIYSLKVNGLEGAGDVDPETTLGTGIAIEDCFDVIKLWHQNKPIDPELGVKRPTVVNMSWGFFSFFNAIVGGSYRGTPWVGTTRREDYGMIGAGSTLRTYSARVGTVDSDVEELIAAGVIVCISAGNEFQKVENVGGPDYDNYFNQTVGMSTVQRYYHRGGSPYSSNAIIVGSMDSDTYSASLEQKSVFSNIGAGVDILAPGSNIMGATSTTNDWGAGSQSYYLNASYKQTNISGSSMAAPQVAGVAALYLQRDPTYTPAEIKQNILAAAITPIPVLDPRLYDDELTNTYTNERSLLGGSQSILYWPYSQYNVPPVITRTEIKGGLSFRGALTIKYI
jgi:subtilisin family serine protease